MIVQKRISYRPLWRILVDRQLPKSYLCYNDLGIHITTKSLARLSRDEGVSMQVLLRICSILDVDLCDICETISFSDHKGE